MQLSGTAELIMAQEDWPRYYRESKNNAFWCPNAFGAKYGFEQSVPLGPRGPDAKKAAIDWNVKLDKARKDLRDGKQLELILYRPGTLGSFYERYFKHTDAWALMEPATRDGYHRAWVKISERFGDTLVSRITPSDSERFHVDLHPAHKNPRDPKGRMKLSWSEANRTLKHWRALLSALVSYRLIPQPAPIGRVTNPNPKGRSEVWLADEVRELADAAAWGGFIGLGVGIRIAWDTMLAPVDVHQLPLKRWQAIEGGGEVTTSRRKTGAKVFHAIRPETADLVNAYIRWLERQGIGMAPDEPLIRRTGARSGNGAPYSRKLWELHFRRVREAAFPGDERRFSDMRRSAATEARMGGATRDDLGKSMANTVDSNDALMSTYVVGASKRVLEAREAGRAPMAAKFRKVPE